MATIYYERFDHAPAHEPARLVGAHVFHDASCPVMYKFGVFMCGVACPDGASDAERVDAPFHVLIVLLSGSAELYDGEDRWQLGAGQFGVLPARGHYGFRRTGDAPMRHVWFLLNDEARWRLLDRGRPWVGTTLLGPHLYDAVSLFQREAQRYNEGVHDTLVLQTLEIVSRQLERLLVPPGQRPEREQRLLSLIDEIHRQPAADWSVPQLCRQIGLGTTQLNRLFLQHYGRAPAQLVFEIRMQLARKWLLNGQRVSDVAAALGYRELASFSRCFNRHFGCAPSRIT
ncbi:AraC family transcriptional regulator [Chitiniphilus purpureus]|uniref:AraC family transcriptional regulator n=1 Tax=Chitiniphilus purpureus TaxID=2981137 RepID=A0ABY6DPR4_9NEIS|nr:AraC family transcriptional regulator [Chitiniphilus sp. CD1]UXY16362.1 AraC family transcriptional regulator [Chitiniphilus sp. CD1]